MNDYINRQEAIEYFMTNTNWHDEDGCPIHDSDDKRKLLTDYFSGVPTANVVSVVRCEECKYSAVFQMDSSGAMARHCQVFTPIRIVADDCYCSYGERREVMFYPQVDGITPSVINTEPTPQEYEKWLFKEPKGEE